VLALLAYATPQFWLGLMLIVLFSITLGVLPSGGMMTIGPDMSAGARALDVARHLLLPTLTLGLFYMAIYARLMRSAMLEVYTQEFITTARANCRAVHGSTDRSIAPSRKCTCQSSGRRRVRVLVMR